MTIDDRGERQYLSRAVARRDKCALRLRLQALHNVVRLFDSAPKLLPSYMTILRHLRTLARLEFGTRFETTLTRGDMKFRVDLADRLGSDIHYGILPELADLLLFVGVLGPQSVVIDVGANFGYYTVACAKVMSDRGRVHAFEPNPDALALLDQNVELNGIGSMVVRHPVALADFDGTADFYVMRESSFSGLSNTERAEHQETITIPVRTLDSIVQEAGLERVDAIKIDVEGYEGSVLRGAFEQCRRHRELLVLLEVTRKNLDAHRTEKLRESLESIFEFGFIGWRRDTQEDALVRIDKTAEAIRGGSDNLFLCRPGTAVESQLHKTHDEIRTLTVALTGGQSDDVAVDRTSTSQDRRRFHLLAESLLDEKAWEIDRLLELADDLRAACSKLHSLRRPSGINNVKRWVWKITERATRVFRRSKHRHALRRHLRQCSPDEPQRQLPTGADDPQSPRRKVS